MQALEDRTVFVKHEYQNDNVLQMRIIHNFPSFPSVCMWTGGSLKKKNLEGTLIHMNLQLKVIHKSI